MRREQNRPRSSDGKTPVPLSRLQEQGKRRKRRLPLFLAGGVVSLLSAVVVMVAAGSLIAAPETDRARPAFGGKDPSGKLLATIGESIGADAPDAKIALEPDETLVARVKRSARGINVFGRPGAKKPAHEITRRDGQDGRLVFAATRQRGRWLKVMLPIRPNGSSGWIRREMVDLSVSDWAAKVDLSDHVISIRRGGETFGEWRIGLGQQETPTPTGEYYMTELLKPRKPDTVYGAYVFVLSGFSEKLTRFAGGNGELGLHGTNDLSGLGRDVSHGCIRMRDGAITKLAKRLPLGTPITIVD